MGADLMAISPPPIPTRAGLRRKSMSRLAPVWIVAGLAALAWTMRLALQWHWPLPQCWLRKLTGIPCPACGCTRSLAAWSSGDLEQALLFNPLFFAVCLGLLVWLGLWTVQRTSDRPLLNGIRARAVRLPWRKIAIALVAINWLYLYLKLPK
jgi:hypothetical protein